MMRRTKHSSHLKGEDSERKPARSICSLLVHACKCRTHNSKIDMLILQNVVEYTVNISGQIGVTTYTTVISYNHRFIDKHNHEYTE